VYAALSAEKYYGLIDTALYLPKEWTEDKKRCEKLGIPKEHRTYKTKVVSPEARLDIVKHQKQLGTRFHFIGADALYGNSYWFQQELDKMGLLFVLEVHSDQYVYTEPPLISIPEKKGNKGRQPTRYKAQGKAVEVRKLAEGIAADKWEEIQLRKTGKGDLNCLGYVQKVYVWDGISAHCDERLLVIRATEGRDGSKEYKYALSNAKEGQYTTEELVQMQSSRLRRDRTFLSGRQTGGRDESLPGKGMAGFSPQARPHGNGDDSSTFYLE